MKKILTIAIILASFIMILNSCQYKFVVEPEIPPPNPEDTISFSQEIIPVFDIQGCTSCHSTNGQQPDLTADNAYSSIIGMGLVATDDPPSSIIYQKPLHDGDHYAKYTSAQSAIVLVWIEQGALDN